MELALSDKGMKRGFKRDKEPLLRAASLWERSSRSPRTWMAWRFDVVTAGLRSLLSGQTVFPGTVCPQMGSIPGTSLKVVPSYWVSQLQLSAELTLPRSARAKLTE